MPCPNPPLSLIRGFTMIQYEHVPFFIAESREATSGSTFTIKSRTRNKDGIAVVETVSVCDQDSDTKVAHIGVMIGSSVHYVKSVALTSKTYFYMVHPNLHLWPGDLVIVKIVTPTSGDKIYVNVFGHYEIPVEVE